MLEQIFDMIFTASFGYSIIRITSPILFAALASVVAEKAGVTNIGLEGTMMFSSLFGALFAYWTNNWFVGVLGAIAVGILIALIIGIFALKLKTDIILAGTAINIAGSGGTIFFLYLFTGLRGNTASLTTPQMLTPKIDIPLIKDIPVVGSIFSGHSILTYVSFLLVIVVWILLYKTALGLRIRAVGENSNAADSVGVSVLKTQYIALMISGALAGIGGAYMSMYYSGDGTGRTGRSDAFVSAFRIRQRPWKQDGGSSRILVISCRGHSLRRYDHRSCDLRCHAA